jgi:hypothetical protein
MWQNRQGGQAAAFSVFTCEMAQNFALDVQFWGVFTKSIQNLYMCGICAMIKR